MMDWSYVAGFFDGEGSVGKPREGTIQLRFCNNDKPVLEDIRNFIACGQIYLVGKSGQRGHKNNYYQLIVSKHDDVLRIAEELVVRCRIKRQRLAWAIDYVRGKAWLDLVHPGRDEKGRWLPTQVTPKMGVEVKTG